MAQQQSVNPWHSVGIWILAAIAGSAGLALAYGFRTSPIEDAAGVAKLLMIGCLALFALSRLLMFVPARAIRSRLARWWVDYVLIIATAVWWIINPDAEAFILVAGAVYVIVVGVGAVVRAGIGSLADGLPDRSIASAGRRLLLAVIVLVVIGGSVLTLPACRRGGQAVESEHSLAWYQLKVEWLDNTFIAAAALTGTGSTVHDIGYHYTRAGQLVILVLMQMGGLGVLCIAAVIGMHLRRLIGWTGVDDDTSPAAMRRMLGLLCGVVIVVEAIGAVGLYRTWDPSVDLNFKTAMEEPTLLGSLIKERTALGGSYDEARLFASVFHSVSGFCDCGLTLSRDGYLVYRDLPGPLLAVVPLMFLGSLGAPVLVELFRRMTRRSDVGLEAVSKDTWVTLGGSLLALLIGAATLFGIESTREYQQRYPRDKTPGRLMVNDSSSADAPSSSESLSHGSAPVRAATTKPVERASIEFSAGTSSRARAERLSTMTTRNRVRASIFHAESARTGGSRAARLDEASLSPASHLVLMGLMLLGGGVGGAAGGLRIGVVALLLAGLWRTRGSVDSTGRSHVPPGADRSRALGTAAAVASATLLLIALVAVVLMYRESASPLACLFESVSACCNVGLSLGMTSDLSLPGRVVVLLAMVLGRAVPLAILLRCMVPVPVVLNRPLVAPAKTPRSDRDDEDAPIPLE
jgi:Trk-type K+ transport system membrane component